MPKPVGNYHNPNTNFSAEAVRLLPEDVGRYAQPVLELLVTSYIRRVCVEAGIAEPADIIKRLGDPENQGDVEQCAERMAASMATDSAYIAVHRSSALHGSSHESDVVAVTKTTPSRPRRLFARRTNLPNAFVNDVLFDQAKPRAEAYGSVALHAALLTYQLEAEVVADTFGGIYELHTETWFYQNFGLKPKGHVKHPFSLEDGRMPPQTRLGGATVDEVQKALMELYPWIANAQLDQE